MALRGDEEGGDIKVDPTQGIFVEMSGIMEVRYYLWDEYEAWDFFEFQQENKNIPEDFCHKDRESGTQNIFYCLVCNCDLKSIIPLRDHVQGQKHIRKALEKKRQVYGLQTEPQNKPKTKKLKAPREKANISITLEARLREIDEPVLGLNNITEFRNPRNKKDIPMYTCSQEGCKSAWGNSDDMFNHAKGHKHQRNFLHTVYPDDPRIGSLNKNELLSNAMQYARDYGVLLSEDRDYLSITICENFAKYRELSNRPQDWSEDKEKLGHFQNSNNVPLNRRSSGARSALPALPSIFNEAQWALEPAVPDPAQFNDEIILTHRKGIETVRTMVDEFNGSSGDPSHQECVENLGFYRSLLEIEIEDLESGGGGTRTSHGRTLLAADKKLLGEVGQLEAELKEKVDWEIKTSKRINKILGEIKQEIQMYMGEKAKKINLETRLDSAKADLEAFNPVQEAFKRKKTELFVLLDDLYNQFTHRSVNDVIVEAASPRLSSSNGGKRASTSGNMSGDEGEPHPKKTSAQKRQEERVLFTGRFTEALTGLVRAKVEALQSLATTKKEEVIQRIVKDKVMPQEIQSFTKKELPWDRFKFTPENEKRISKFLSNYLNTKYPKR